IAQVKYFLVADMHRTKQVGWFSKPVAADLPENTRIGRRRWRLSPPREGHRQKHNGDQQAGKRGYICFHTIWFRQTKIDNTYQKYCYNRSADSLQYDILYQGTFQGIIGVIMQAAALLPELSLFDDKIAHRDQVADFTKLRRHRRRLVQRLNLFMQEVKPFHRPLQTRVCPDDTHIITHQQLQFLETLSNADHLLGLRRPFGIPVRYVIPKRDAIHPF